MPKKLNTKPVREANRTAWLALMAEFNAQPIADDYDPSTLPHRITLKGCTLICRFDDGADDDLPSVFSRWCDPMDKIRAAGLPYHNQFSGKWNHHEPEGAACIASFANGLRPHKPSNYAHQQIGAYTLEQDYMGGITLKQAGKPWREVYLQPGDDAQALGLTPTEAQIAEYFA